MKVGAALAVLLGAGPVLAQSVDAPRVLPSPFLTLNQERLYQASEFGQRVRAELEALAADLSEENRRIDAALTEEERRLTDERPSMDPSDFRALATDFDERVTAIRQAQQAKQASIQQQGDQERARFFELAFPILLGLVEETGAVAILNDAAVIFSVRQIDITDAAIARINTEIGAAPRNQDNGQAPQQRPQVEE